MAVVFFLYFLQPPLNLRAKVINIYSIGKFIPEFYFQYKIRPSFEKYCVEFGDKLNYLKKSQKPRIVE